MDNKLGEAIYLALHGLHAQLARIDGHKHGSTNPYMERSEKAFQEYLEALAARESIHPRSR